VLGFIFLPLTTLVYAYVSQTMGDGAGGVSVLGWILTAVAVLLDIGMVGRGGGHYRRRRVVEVVD
jgi:hypothetical protein